VDKQNLFRSLYPKNPFVKNPYESGKPNVVSYLKACPVPKVRRPLGGPGPSCPGHRTGCPIAAQEAAAAGRTAAGLRAAAAASFHMSPPPLLCRPG
jgi:hypothetical protein